METIKEHKWAVLAAAALIILCLVLWLWLSREKPEEVQYTSQEKAETVQEVQKLAGDAGVKLDTAQAKEVTETIREIRVTEQVPVYIVQTTASELPAKVEEAREEAGADFSVVTYKDPAKADAEVDVSKMETTAPVELNQYNINAYKKHLNTIEYMPQEKVIGYTHQWKVSDNGHYMGVGLDYDWDDKAVYAKITYSW